MPRTGSTPRPSARSPNLLDEAGDVEFFVRLQIGDLPILWAEGRDYNPDFIVVDSDGTHWVVEVKMDKEMATATVRDKREAARRWANHVSADDAVAETWRYLLVSEIRRRHGQGLLAGAAQAWLVSR